MPNPTELMLLKQPGGLYESWYFCGTSADGQTAFWLKHNLLRPFSSPATDVECSLVLFDKSMAQPQVIHVHTRIPEANALKSASPTAQWSTFRFAWSEQSWVEITPDRLRGRLQQEHTSAEWDLQLHPSHQTLYHFPHALWYHSPWPKKKILTNDIHLGFIGTLSINNTRFNGAFLGMNGHNWGREHAWQYAYANCGQFANDRLAYFDGMTARLALLNGRIHSPPLSLACLKTEQRWYRFDQLLRAARHPVRHLKDYCWAVALHNDRFLLDIHIQAAPGPQSPWVALHYNHPNGQRSVVKNTKFADIQLRLYDREHHCLDTLHSSLCELETLMPWNSASAGFTGQV